MPKKLLTISEYNSLRGKQRWAGISKKERSKAMKALADKRWAKKKKKAGDNSIAT